MNQQQTQSHFSRVPSSTQSQPGQAQDASQDPSLSPPTKPDATSPYEGPASSDQAPSKRRDRAADAEGPEAMAHPHFSEAQSTLGAFAPARRPGDSFAEPEDALDSPLAAQTASPAEQPQAAPASEGAQFVTSAGTLREGMSVVDSYGHALGILASVDGERLRLSSTDPHDDGVAFLPVSLIDGIDGNRVLLSGRGDASFGMSGE